MSIYTEKAVALFREGYNCAQAVTGAFAEPFGMSQEDALRFSEGMGAGMGRLRLTCGAVSAMALLAGLKLSNGKPNDLTTRKEVYAVVQEMTKAFQEKNGSIICAELLGAARPKHETAQPEAPAPDSAAPVQPAEQPETQQPAEPANPQPDTQE